MVVTVACLDVVIDEGRLTVGVIVGFIELPKELVANVGEALVGWAVFGCIDIIVDEG